MDPAVAGLLRRRQLDGAVLTASTIAISLVCKSFLLVLISCAETGRVVATQGVSAGVEIAAALLLTLLVGLGFFWALGLVFSADSDQ